MRARLTTAFLALSVSTANAATVITFDSLPIGDTVPATYVESGVTVAGSPGSYTRAGAVHMDDGGTFYAKTIQITTGAAFSALGVDIFGLGQNSFIFDDDLGEVVGVPHENVFIKGFLGGSLVAELSFSTGLATALTQVRFDSSFADIDLLTVTADSVLMPGMECFEYPCGHFDLDNLIVGAVGEELAPVPLPAAGWMLLAGVAALGVRLRPIRAGLRSFGKGRARLRSARSPA
ncbi:VPLPA-CTERM sorting domain-containing protein [Cereibacter sp. SYSU M97828]|nr:VPLPA-CTERM sorting domain-containing protein [Cereibacter flavus]